MYVTNRQGVIGPRCAQQILISNRPPTDVGFPRVIDTFEQIDIFHSHQPVFALRASTGSLRDQGLACQPKRHRARRLVGDDGIEPPTSSV
jgi:hypothetical protein